MTTLPTPAELRELADENDENAKRAKKWLAQDEWGVPQIESLMAAIPKYEAYAYACRTLAAILEAPGKVSAERALELADRAEKLGCPQIAALILSELASRAVVTLPDSAGAP